MTRLVALFAAVGLCACDQTRTVDHGLNLERKDETARLPFENSIEVTGGFSLRVSREGNLFWNEVPVSEAVLKDYIRQFSALSPEADRLFVAFEPGVSRTRSDWVRRQVTSSGLCEQRRCAEVSWSAKWPVVN
ncbi:hypothetical protein [Sphingomonas sp. G-3-2-10]|uniref:hypothetical protein n=1 Tax=Sphingomonas sp. G-3-2-10 TaxID=2728838 RepID=UPI00146E2270|nr:hypothetical protein [Sphingomonas sp. G-3-2-10]NML07295.1 hypothetical protein [Sphingomonas sp. G-3-2-10]